ncbi:hypothetical protein HHI36_011238 [Cryptolaemus montrouzieri]|uniref:Uncharacterized protein n=1 Tax=Cryptolaemus montrouzieri TaxID=559131 RepID=A0ABD2ML58_9CUCU
MIMKHLLGFLPLLAIIGAAYPSPRAYYGTNSQSYLEDYYRYYPQESYSVFYPRTPKYDLYQTALPSYYQKSLSDISDGYDGYYYDMDPAELQEEMLQEVEREEREDSQPIGHEMLYENEDYSNNRGYDKASVAYFQNLARKNKNERYKLRKDSSPYMDYSDDYENEWHDIPATKLPPSRSKEDKEVQDLRKLKSKHSKAKQNRKIESRNDYFSRNQMHDEYKRSSKETSQLTNYITSSVPKTQLKQQQLQPIIKIPASTTGQPSPLEPKKEVRGQKEEVMIRPATPVRHPFNAPLMNLVVNNEERKRSPSVFDTLKRMLEMEKSLKNKFGDENLRPAMKKRIISDEDSLIHQLTVLKKSK